jgi:long-chain acyl-CoA synthetase
MDQDGYFHLSDRKKDMIIAGGYNVYPADVEAVLFEHPKVREAAVIGIADPRLGETVKAYIVLKEGQTATQEEIIAFCRERMAAYKAPRTVYFVAYSARKKPGSRRRRGNRPDSQARYHVLRIA